ncbi:MAG: GerAB/ArcD/ProY family transporter [Clostridia bacterium]|nr:GerAB/ArcD/ProY family transporter [Clostridia bacterium]
MDKTVFGRFECACIVINLVCAKMLFTAPRLFAANSRTAVFIVLASDIAAAGLFVFLFLRLMPDEELDIIDLAGKYLGRRACVLAALSGAAFWLFKLTLESRIYCLVTTAQCFDKLPKEFLCAALCLGASLIAYMGVETAARLCALFVPICVVVVFFISAMAVPAADVYMLFPIFGAGPKSAASDMTAALDSFNEWYVLAMLMPHIRKIRLLRSSARASFTVASLVSAAIVILYFALPDGAPRSASISPALLISQAASIFGHAPRLDIYIIIIQSFGALLYAACALFFFAYSLSRALSLPDCRPAVIPSGIFLFAACLIREDHALIQYFGRISLVLCEAFGFLLPLILLTAVNYKKRRSKTA